MLKSSTFQLITLMSPIFFAMTKSGSACKGKTFLTACKEVRIANNETMLHKDFANSQNTKNNTRTSNKYGNSSVNKLKNHQCAGSKYFTLAPTINKTAVIILVVTNTFFVNLLKKGFFI